MSRVRVEAHFSKSRSVVSDGEPGSAAAKYDRYGPSIVGTIVSAQAVASTLRLVPRAR